MDRKKIIQLWLCFAYFVVVFFFILNRAMWGFLRVSSEYRDATIPKEIFSSILSSVTHDFWLHAILVGIGILIFGFLLITIKQSEKTMNKKEDAI